jgi:para-nitrobenzyl esterase
LDKYNWLQHTRDWGPADRKLSEEMMDSLIAFAKTGDPNTASVKWPAWKASSEQYEDFNDGARPMALNVKGMDWLLAHKATPVPAPGAPVNAGPRD